MNMDLETLKADIDSARGDYLAERQILLNKMGWVYADGQSAADALESFAEELGPDQAAQQFLVLPDKFGDLGPRASDQLVAETYDELKRVLERVLDAQDRLDLLIRQREQLLATKEPGRLQVVHVQGREYTVDAEAGVVRSVEGEERFTLEGERDRAEGLSLTEQFARETGAEKARPGPERDRTRGR